MNAAVLEPTARPRSRVSGLTSAGHFQPRGRRPGQDQTFAPAPVDADPERVSRLPAHLPPLPPTNRSVPANFLG